MIPQLKDHLVTSLKTATELHVAVALMNDFGLDIIEGSVDPAVCKRRYLLGTHLPTSPSVLWRLLKLSNESDKVEVKIHRSNRNYHPKVYLIRNTDGLFGFMGSANATKGGMTNNIEMNYGVTNDDCIPLFEWFGELFNNASKLDDAFIKRYEIVYRKNKQIDRTRQSNLNSMDNQFAYPASTLDSISLDHFFTKPYYLALRPEVHHIAAAENPAVEQERQSVVNRLLELGDMMYDSFSDYGMVNLERPKTIASRTSRHSITGRKKYIDALWLHYGKTDEELASYGINEVEGFGTLTNHVRLQVILRYIEGNVYFGIWLYVGKSNGSWYDRDHFIESLDDPNFLKTLRKCFDELGGSYRISIGQDPPLNVGDIENEEQLKTFLKRDDKTSHYKIERNYSPADMALTTENIKKTVLSEFGSLYKLYELYKHRYLFVGRPSDFSSDKLNALALMIETGGQVDANELLTKIENCEYVGFFVSAGEMVATAAIKKKTAKSVLNRTLKAGLTYHEKQVPLLELGYCFTKPEARGKGINKLVISALLKRIPGKMIYAVTPDAAMKNILGQNGFEKKGKSFKGSINPVLEYWELHVPPTGTLVHHMD